MELIKTCDFATVLSTVNVTVQLAKVPDSKLQKPGVQLDISPLAPVRPIKDKGAILAALNEKLPKRFSIKPAPKKVRAPAKLALADKTQHNKLAPKLAPKHAPKHAPKPAGHAEKKQKNDNLKLGPNHAKNRRRRSWFGIF